MRQGTTPTHTFRLPVDAGTLKQVKIIYVQCGKRVLAKYKNECAIDGEIVRVTLSQEETFKFECCYPAEVLVRALTADGRAPASKPMPFTVEPSYDDEVLT